MGVVLVGTVAYLIALPDTHTIYILVNYAWSGIGSSFGPLVILSLHYKGVNKYGAWAGILGGGLTSGIWPLFNSSIFPMIPGFITSMLLILLVSNSTRGKVKKLV